MAAAVLAAATVAAMSAAVAARSRAFHFEAAPFDSYAILWSGGQLQFFHGVHLVLNYDRPAPESTSTAIVPTIDRVAWDAPEQTGSSPAATSRPQVGRFRLMMRSWPPLTETASFLAGGQVAVPIAITGQAAAIEYREFGWRYGARAMPAWPIIAAPALFAAWFASRAWRATILPGGCQSCGYDLRASPDRCPECGRAAPARGVAG